MKKLNLKKTKLNPSDKAFLESLNKKHGLTINKKEIFVNLYTTYTPTLIVNKLGSYFYDYSYEGENKYHFLKGIKASDIISLFLLEKVLASSLLDITLDVERRLKASIVNSLCEYTKNYDVPFGTNPSFLGKVNNRELDKIIEDLYEKRESELTEEDIKKPFRFLIFDTTFGSSIAIFDALNDVVKNIIIQKWPTFENNILNFKAMLHLVRSIRNCIAHGDLLIKFQYEPHREIVKQLDIDLTNTHGIMHLFNCLQAIDLYFYPNQKGRAAKTLEKMSSLFTFTIPAIERIKEMINLPK